MGAGSLPREVRIIHLWGKHTRTFLAVDILKVTHKGQHAAMRPARHHYCTRLSLLSHWSSYSMKHHNYHAVYDKFIAFARANTELIPVRFTALWTVSMVAAQLQKLSPWRRHGFIYSRTGVANPCLMAQLLPQNVLFLILLWLNKISDK